MLKFSMSYKGALVQWENISLAAKGSGVRIPYAPYVKAAEMSFFLLCLNSLVDGSIALQEQVDMIVIRQNKQWKQESNIGKRNNQQFCFIPHRLLIQRIMHISPD